MARRRGLTPEDKDLWARVARTAAPLHPERPRPPEPEARIVPKPAPPRPRSGEFSIGEFSIGQAARPKPSAPPAPSSPAQRLAQQALRMDHKVHRRMAQGKLSPEARLDLHGLTLAAAHPALIGFVLSCHARGHRLVLVITGKGRGDHGPLPTRPGALRHQVPHWLHMPPLSAVVQQVAPAHHRHGGEGAYYVYLRRA
ncbi:Smr/MutS family protein [Paracoccus angustae]|uniref:Smr/MutS family protein n=1 Tax=Paracoccus angustae TaxID=1671480 RepID=A0ABV7U5U3_9RHOB